MKIGFTTIKQNIPQLETLCQHVIYLPPESMTAQTLLDLVRSNPATELLTCAFEDLGLQLVQVHPTLKYLVENNRTIRFLNLTTDPTETNAFLLELAESEKNLMSKRAKLSAEATVAAGKSRGRKRLSQAKIDQIQQLHQEKKTIREIATICNVSLGTAFNYTRKEK